MSEDITDAVENLCAAVAKGSASRNEPDAFRPAFDVPENPPHVFINFQSASISLQEVDRSLSIEGKLKSVVLRSDGVLSKRWGEILMYESGSGTKTTSALRLGRMIEVNGKRCERDCKDHQGQLWSWAGKRGPGREHMLTSRCPGRSSDLWTSASYFSSTTHGRRMTVRCS